MTEATDYAVVRKQTLKNNIIASLSSALLIAVHI
jgi:hypothetical protein